MNNKDCLFCKIIEGQIPTDPVYEDEHVFVFKDIQPKAPVHLLVVPKKHIDSTNQVGNLKEVEIARLLSVLPELAQKFNIDKSGYRTIVNCGSDAGQEVHHLHIHLLGGKKFTVFA